MVTSYASEESAVSHRTAKATTVRGFRWSCDAGAARTVGATLHRASVAPDASSPARITATYLQVDAATAEVLRVEVVCVESLLLKGISLTRWLSTPDDPGQYLDCDLLVRPVDLTAAERVRSDLGFAPAPR